MNSNDTSKNTQSDNKSTDIKNLGRTNRVHDKTVKHGKKGNGKTFRNDKIGRGESSKGGQGDIVDVLNLKQLACYKPVGREFMNCDLETIYQHYLKIIRDVFGITPKHFIDKSNLKKPVNYLVTDKENLLEIVKFLNKFQDEI